MFDFIQSVFHKIVSVVATGFVTVGFISAPQPIVPVMPDNVEPATVTISENTNTQVENNLKPSSYTELLNVSQSQKVENQQNTSKNKVRSEQDMLQEQVEKIRVENDKYWAEHASENPLNRQQESQGIFCDGQYWQSCPSGLDFICPSTGGARCEYPPRQQSGIYCNGKYWKSCSTGFNFSCPADGSVATCVPNTNYGSSYGNSFGQTSSLKQFTDSLNQCVERAKILSQQCWDNSEKTYQSCLQEHANDTDGGNYYCTITKPVCSSFVSSCAGVQNSYNYSNAPTKNYSSGITNTLEKQKQENFNRDVCEKAWGSYFLGTCL